jgi:hypothetical protein
MKLCHLKENDGVVKQNKPDSERQILHILSHMQNLDLKQLNESKQYKNVAMNVKGGLGGTSCREKCKMEGLWGVNMTEVLNMHI